MNKGNRHKNTMGMFDIIKGIGIICVIIEHTITLFDINIDQLQNEWKYGIIIAAVIRIVRNMMMPMFFLVSGYGFRVMNISVKKLKKQIGYLVKPYMYISLSTTILFFFRHYLLYGYLNGALVESIKLAGGFLLGVTNEFSIGKWTLYSIGASWYILTLCFSWIILLFICQVFKEKACIGVGVSMITGWILGILCPYMPFCINQSLVAAGFLYFGYIAKKRNWFTKSMPWYTCFLLLIPIVTLILGKANFGENTWKLGPVDMIGSIVLASFAIKTMLHFNHYAGKFLFLFGNIGKFSLWAYCVHCVEMNATIWYEVVIKIKNNLLLNMIMIFLVRSLLIYIGVRVIQKVSTWNLKFCSSIRKSFVTKMYLKETEKIDYRFKIVYAVSIVMVVCAHCEGGGISLFYDWFPTDGSVLAIFMFCSGYFYKDAVEDNVRKYIIKKIKSLLIPMYAYNLFYALFVQVLRIKGFTIGGSINLKNLLIMPIMNGHQFEYNLGGWFIVPLLMVEIYNVLLRKIFRLLRLQIIEWQVFLGNMGLGIFGVYLASIGYNKDWMLIFARMLYFIPFYSIGILYKKSLEKYDNKIIGIWYFSLIFLVKIIIACRYERMPAYTVSWCRDFTEGPVIPFITGFLEIAFWLRIARIAEPAIGRNKYVNLIANNTYTIMMNQFLGFMIIKTIYAILSKFIPYFGNFDWIRYKTNLLYYPEGLAFTKIFYLVAGIMFPIIIQYFINLIKEKGSLKIQTLKRSNE